MRQIAAPEVLVSHRSTLLAFLLLTSSASAQVAETWALTIDHSPLGETIEASLVDPSGDSTHVGAVAVSGSTNPTHASITRVDAQGVPVWNRTLSFDTGWRTSFVDVDRGPGGSFYAGGSTRAPTAVNSSAVLARYAADGTEMWWVRVGYYLVPGDAAAIATDPSGDLWAVGNVISPNSPHGRTVLLMRVSPTGSLHVSRTWSVPSIYDPIPRDIVPDGQGGAYIVGGGAFVAESTSNAFVLHVDADGDELWSRTLTGGVAYGSDAAVDATGNLYVTGQIAPPSILEQPFLAKFDAGGNELWRRMITDPSHLVGRGQRVDIDARGDLVVAGAWGSFLTPTHDVFVCKYDASGNNVWTRNWAGPVGRDDVRALALDEGGEIAIAGLTVPTGQTAIADALALRLDRDGRVLWARTYGLPSTFDQGTGIGFGPIGSVVLGAISGGEGLVVRLGDAAVPFCFGDGSGTACPCGNATPSSERSGCASTLGIGGRLSADGSTSLANDTLTLRGSGMTNASALYFQGTTQVGAGAGSVFGDGLRCAGGTTVRLATSTNVAGASQFPAAGDPSVSVRGAIAAPGTRTYQVWYRNAAAFCTSDTFNLTNGVQVTWTN